MALTTAESCSQPDSTLLQRHHPNLSFEDMQQQLHSVPPSASWTPVYSASSIQFCMLKVAPMSQGKVERSITVNTDMSRHVHIAGKLVPIATNKVLRDFPCRISEVKCLQCIMECVERAHICPGNPHPGGGNENPTVEQFRTNAAILMQQQQTRHDLKTMNVIPDKHDVASMPIDEPLPKRTRKH